MSFFFCCRICVWGKLFGSSQLNPNFRSLTKSTERASKLKSLSKSENRYHIGVVDNWMANASKKLHLSRKADIPLQAARLSAVSLTPHATPHLSGTKQLVATSGCICVCWLNQSFRSLHMIVAKMIFTKELTEFFLAIKKFVDQRQPNIWKRWSFA